MPLNKQLLYQKIKDSYYARGANLTPESSLAADLQAKEISDAIYDFVVAATVTVNVNTTATGTGTGANTGGPVISTVSTTGTGSGTGSIS
jgi:hypothetical protein